jgi:hypothetical protein
MSNAELNNLKEGRSVEVNYPDVENEPKWVPGVIKSIYPVYRSQKHAVLSPGFNGIFADIKLQSGSVSMETHSDLIRLSR